MSLPRACFFFDGQNLYHGARAAFDRKRADYDPLRLSMAICDQRAWVLQRVRFYTGVPKSNRQPGLHRYWTSKLNIMAKHPQVTVVKRKLRYHAETKDGREVFTAREKGIDVRLALDVLRAAEDNEFDVAVLVSEDADLREVLADVRGVARRQGRNVRLCSAFPFNPKRSRGAGGIPDTERIRIEEDLYSACLDLVDHFAQVKHGSAAG